MQTTRTVDVPVLRRGFHPHPRRGACLMELVGALSGGCWTDRPASVHPVLAAACRAVNDRMDDGGRASLLAFVPWAGCLPPEPQARTAVSLNERLVRLAGHYAGGSWSATDARRPQSAARLVKQAVRVLSGRPDGSEQLWWLLFDMVNEVRRDAAQPPVVAARLRLVPAVATLPVKVSYRCPDDGLSAYVHCVADLAGWPADLVPDRLAAAPGAARPAVGGSAAGSAPGVT